MPNWLAIHGRYLIIRIGMLPNVNPINVVVVVGTVVAVVVILLIVKQTN